jgi:phosphatidylinositol alpha-mannosyltransferase
VRIAIVCPYSLDRPGGVQGQVLGLALELRTLGHHVDTLAPGDPRPSKTPQRIHGGSGRHFSVGRSFGVPVNGSTAPMAPQPAAAWRTRKMLERGSYDVVHLHEPLAPSITIPALAMTSLPLVGTFHAAGERTPYRIPGLAPVLRPLAGRLKVRAAVSTAAAELAHRHLGGTYHIVGNGLDPACFSRPGPSPQESRSILFLGRNEPRKGLAVLLQAMRMLPDDVVLWIAGPRRPSRELRPGTDHRVRWLGPLDEVDKVDRLSRASVVCAPSLGGESFGMVLLEAMAAGTPVVASDLAGYRAAAGSEYPAALLVPPGDAAALARALQTVLDHNGLRRSISRAGTDRVQSFTLGALSRRYVELYLQATSGGAVRTGVGPTGQ